MQSGQRRTVNYYRVTLSLLSPGRRWVLLDVVPLPVALLMKTPDGFLFPLRAGSRVETLCQTLTFKGYHFKG